MVHTAELTYFPDHELFEAFKNLPDTVYYQQQNTWWNSSLKEDYGLTFRIKKIGNPYRQYESIRMICRINFKKVIACNHPEYNHRVDIMTVWDVDEVEQQFNTIIEQFLPIMPQFEFWKVNRIDYCVNIQTRYVDEYIELLKKGDRPWLKDWYDRQGNYTQKKGSLYLVSTAKKKKNRSVTINFYNKQDQLQKQFGVPEDELQFDEIDPTLELAENILRLEVQCHRAKTEALKKKYGMDGKYVKEFLNYEIAYDVLKNYLLRIAGTSDYHRKQIAYQMIDDGSFKDETKLKLKQIIANVSIQHSNVSKVRERYAEDGTMSKDEYSRLLRKLQDKNINPVTIRNNKSLVGKRLKEGLPSLVTLFEEAWEDEMTVSL